MQKSFIPWLIIVGLWAVIHVTMAVQVDPRVWDWQLTGPDEYMRLVRVAELRDGEGWYDNVILRSNAPYGDALHWTRPFDVLILLAAYPLSAVLGADEALFVSGAALSPLLALLISFAVAWAAYPLLGRERALLAAVFVLFQPAVMAYTAAGRADHHSLLFLLSALAFGATLRLLAARPERRTAAAAGATYGLALWASVELILLIALCQAMLAWGWIRFRQPGARLPAIAAAAFLATTAVALVAEHPPGALLAVELDRFSIPHVALAAACLAIWLAARTIEAIEARLPGADTPARRGAAVGAAGAVCLLAVIAAFPGLLGGPLGDVDPRVLRIWNARVGESDSLAPTDLFHAGNLLYLVGSAIPCTVYAALTAWRQRNDVRSLPWMLAALLLAGYFLMSVLYVRMAPFAEMFSVTVMAEIIGRMLDWSSRQSKRLLALLAASATALLLTSGGFVAGGYLLSLWARASDATADPECRIPRIAPVLNDPSGLGAAPLTIAALIDHGPELLYRTPHSVVGAPYHRNGSGILDSYRVFAAPSEEESRKIVTRRGIGLLLVCPTRAERQYFAQETGESNLYARLVEGKPPVWLAEVPVEAEKADGFRLYRVVW